jgi:aminoacrylate hydrolase
LIAGLYHEEHGPADAPPVILSSGLGGSAAYWAPNLEVLSKRHRVIAYDHRGTGRSDRALPQGLTVEDMAADVLALMDGLAIERAHLVGHAAGGAIGLSLALSAPERLSSLVVINGWSAIDPHFARCFETRLALLRDSGVRAYLRAQPIFLYPAPWIADHDDELDREMAHQLASFPGVEAVEARIAALKAFHIADRLAEFSMPLLALAAKDDMLVPWTCSRALAEGAPGATLELMDWGGHACNVTDPAAFNCIAVSWLNAAHNKEA